MTATPKNIAKGFALALAATTGMASAGGLDRSGQSTAILFESGNYVKLSFGLVTPSITGNDPSTAATGNMAPAYSVPSLAAKMEINDKLSFAVMYDQPYGADVAYTGGAFTGTTVDVQSSALTALVKYNVSDRISVFGGASYQTLSADVAINVAAPLPPAAYSLEMDAASGVGYVLGAAYEIPEMALRVALTYRSEITSTHDILEAGIFPDTMDVVTPQSVNLDFQSGINPKTLVFGSVRWVNWSAFTITPPIYGSDLVSYDDDVITYSLGVGRKITDALSVAATVGYEHASGAPGTSILAPTDGNISLGIGATYTMDNVKITAGVRQVWVGDSSGPGIGTWTGNSAVAAGFSVGYSF